VWHCIVRALSLIKMRARSQIAAAELLLKRAIEIDSNSAPAFALLSFIHTLRVHLGWHSREKAIPTAIQIADKALTLNSDEPWAYLALGYAGMFIRDDQTFKNLEYALKLDPNLACAHYFLALASSFAGNTDEAFKHADLADGVKAYDLLSRCSVGAHDNVRATACFIAGRYHDGIAFARKVIAQNPRQTPAYRQIVTNSAFADESKHAEAALRIVKRLAPNVRQWLDESAISWSHKEDYKKYVEAFRAAGFR
jgi:adenylate cyclase